MRVTVTREHCMSTVVHLNGTKASMSRGSYAQMQPWLTGCMKPCGNRVSSSKLYPWSLDIGLSITEASCDACDIEELIYRTLSQRVYEGNTSGQCVAKEDLKVSRSDSQKIA